MSLEHYRRPRLVVLRPSASAYEAARAMADNHIGAVLIGEDHELVGIVTDRDLALEIIAGSLDPRAPLREIMSDELVTVEVSAMVNDVVRLMQERGCRRVPVVEEGRPVGMVTLDDLLLEGDIDQRSARRILQAQLEAAAPLKPAGETHPTDLARARGRRAFARRLARAEATYGRLLHAVEQQAALKGREQAELALTIGLGALCRRLLPTEARHLLSQLPSRLHAVLAEHLVGPDKRITAAHIEAELAAGLGLSPERAAEVLSAVLEVVASCVSAGEIEDVRAQLPAAMKDLLPAAPMRMAS